MAAFFAVSFCFTTQAQEADKDNLMDYKEMLESALESGQYQQASQKWDARINQLSGDVQVKIDDREDWIKVTEPVPLDSNDRIKTGHDGYAEIALDDKGIIRLERNSEVEISSIEQADSEIGLILGSIVAKIQNIFGSKHNLRVKTPAAVCAVRGTEFAVEYSPLSKETAVAVFDEGKVNVSMTGEEIKDTGEYLLEKNTEIVLNPMKRRFRPGKIARMARHRMLFAGLRTKMNGLRKGWKPRSLSQREELRSRILRGKLIQRQIKKKIRKKKVERRKKIKE